MKYTLEFYAFAVGKMVASTAQGDMDAPAIKHAIIKEFAKGDADTFRLILTLNGVSVTYTGMYDDKSRMAVYNAGSPRRYSIIELFDMLDRYDRAVNKAKRAEVADLEKGI